MKNSHIHAPRSLSECQFLSAGDPFERPTARPRRSFAWGVCFLVAVLLAAAAVKGM